MRTREERLTYELSTILDKIDADIQRLSQAIAAQEKSINSLVQATGTATQASDEARGMVEGVGKTVTGETRSVREQLANITQRMQMVDSRLNTIETSNASLLSQIDIRLKALGTQVTSSVMAVVIIVAATALIMLLLR